MQQGGFGRARSGMIVDTHAHLCDPAFDPDREEVCARARAAGVAAIVCVGESLEDARRNLALADRYAGLRPAAGLYPGRLDEEEAEALVGLIRRERGRLAAVGEVGLDYWLVREEEEPAQNGLPPRRELQHTLFRRFVDLAMELDLPLNVHSRAAGRQTIALLLERGARRVQLHAFDGRAATALPAVEAGYFFSMPPSVVRSRQKQKLLRHLPLECLLVESDSPALGPEMRIRNEPANTRVAVHAIAEIKDVPEQRLIGILAENTARLYGQ
ncbi:MAG: TatD family hydrolase [Spirochaetales bacterium]|nr:TatD family hydrolase [Spirochaetales bacterium]